MNLLKNASNWLEEQRTEHASRTVTYERGVDTVDVSASIGRTIFDVDNGFGVVERIESRDFLVLTDDLTLGGGRTLPERGDRVKEVQGDSTFIYEVMAPGKEPHWRYSDPYRKALRIHTKHVATEGS
ncbi:MAG: hypothetical protein ABGZ35_05360 [Planctomycetaceae bacterium]